MLENILPKNTIFTHKVLDIKHKIQFRQTQKCAPTITNKKQRSEIPDNETHSHDYYNNPKHEIPSESDVNKRKCLTFVEFCSAPPRSARRKQI